MVDCSTYSVHRIVLIASVELRVVFQCEIITFAKCITCIYTYAQTLLKRNH